MDNELILGLCAGLGCIFFALGWTILQHSKITWLGLVFLGLGGIGLFKWVSSLESPFNIIGFITVGIGMMWILMKYAIPNDSKKENK